MHHIVHSGCESTKNTTPLALAGRPIPNPTMSLAALRIAHRFWLPEATAAAIAELSGFGMKEAR